jgi:hypothetical protein
MLRLVAVGVGDVGEVNVEWCLRLEHAVGGFQRDRKGLDVRERAVARRVHVREVEYWADPSAPAGDRDDVVEAAEVVDAAHHLDSERHRAVLALEALAELGELLADGRDRRGPVSAEQEAGVEDDELGARSLGDPCGVVEHSDGHPLLLVALEVAHEARDGRVDGQHDLRLTGELAEPRGPGVVHPETAFEVDLAGGETALLQDPDRLAWTAPRRNARRAETQLRHGVSLVRPTP